MNRNGLNYIRIDRSLGKPFDPVEFFASCSKTRMNLLTDNFSLRFRIAHIFKRCEETIGGVDPINVQPHLFIGIQHLVELIFPEQAIIDKKAIEIFANRLVQDRCSHSGINTAGERKHHMLITHFNPNFSMVCSTNDAGVQSWWQFADFYARSYAAFSTPSMEWATSG
jgi:hypothetical protein